jgi:hypothetical protein
MAASRRIPLRKTRDGKEGVDGSSPSEGSFKRTESLQMAGYLLPLLTL